MRNPPIRVDTWCKRAFQFLLVLTVSDTLTSWEELLAPESKEQIQSAVLQIGPAAKQKADTLNETGEFIYSQCHARGRERAAYISETRLTTVKGAWG